MKLFDLHCDTATRIYEGGVPLKNNDYHISLDKAASFDKYVQLTAVFTSTELSDDEGYARFWKVRDNLLEETRKNNVRMITSSRELVDFEQSSDKVAFILTVEDARILCEKKERIKELYDAGVRVITPLWGGKTIIGGSHDTSPGLSDFGRETVEEMLSLGIIPDISHASFSSADEIISMCEEHGKVAFASHSDSYTVNHHSRNLTDDRFKRISSRGGVCGINLCTMHLSEKPENASIDTVVEHILHFADISPFSVALGCDLDGTDLPRDIGDVSYLPKIASALRKRKISEQFIDRLYYCTAYEFMKNNLPRE